MAAEHKRLQLFALGRRERETERVEGIETSRVQTGQ